MDSRKLLFPLLSLFVFSLFLGQGSARSFHRHFHFRPTKLFVFGDSYVDTGNINSTISGARNTPYGITFPGVPFGRFSDGLILTDYFANYLGIKSPLPYSAWQKVGIKSPIFGMNFAYGGTGIFNTFAPFPNMTTQIDIFKSLITSSIFTPKDITSSIALVSPSGNDYNFYLATNGSLEGFKPLIISIVNQIGVNLKRIHSLGVNKIAVTGMGPVGCLPQLTAPSFNQCNSTMNSLVEFHNLLLNQVVEKLNNETKGSSPFFILNIYDTILAIIKNKGNPKVRARFETPLKPCCFGVKNGFSCGSLDANGNKMYTLCKYPKMALFWDSVHPTQQGWLATFSSLSSNLEQNL